MKYFLTVFFFLKIGLFYNIFSQYGLKEIYNINLHNLN